MPFNIGKMFNGIFKKILKPLQKIGDSIKSVFRKIADVGYKIRDFFVAIGKFFEWFFVKFLGWFFVPWPASLFSPIRQDEGKTAGLIPWMLRYLVLFIYGIILFPKCFIWFILNTGTWLLYTPFRFIFWMIDAITGVKIVKMEHDFWNFLNSIDYFVHGPKNNFFLKHFTSLRKPVKDPIMGAIEYKEFTYTSVSGNEVSIDIIDGPITTLEDDKDSLNLGFHIIHFPDSIMELCFSANPYRLAVFPKYDPR